MGFLSGFRKGLNYDAVDAYADEDSSQYRKRGLENAESNAGWYKCIKCGKSYRKDDMEIDHILPKSLGGANTRDNLQCICMHCNRSKRADTSETAQDLVRRRKELKEQDKADREFLKKAMKYKDQV
jgi:5-methylcytosine-specific restriction endonuclease McrA|nr:HNH endonuclease signature motif containing protein [uncultured Acetatifactor sp.]